MNRLHTATVTAALIAAVTSFVPQLTYAASIKSLTLSPSSTNLVLDSGVSASRDLTIINDGDVSYTVSLSAAPYSVQGENYDPVFTRLPGTKDASQWVTLSQKSLTLAAHQTVDVPYSITAPSATAPGGYYAVLFAETSGASDDGSGVSASNRVGDILYITVNGAVKEAGTIAAAETPGFTFGNIATLGLTVTNTGGVHYQSDAHFHVQNPFNTTKLDTTLTRYVLPQTTRLFNQDFSPTGLGGIYKVSRSATVAGATQTLPDSWIVVVRPQVIPLIIFIVLTISGFIILLRRTRKHKH